RARRGDRPGRAVPARPGWLLARLGAPARPPERPLPLRGRRASGPRTIAAGPGPYSTDLFAADALAVARDLGIDHAYVVGLSMGGMIAQKLALAAPDFVDALVLCDPSTHTGRRAGEMRQAAAAAVRAGGFGALGEHMTPDTTGWAARTLAEKPHIARNN